MNRRTLLFLILTVCIASAAAADSGNRTVSVTVVPGKNYEHKHRFGLINMLLRPQIAVWAENARGEFIETIFVTERGGSGSWRGRGVEARPEALPVWYSVAGTAMQSAPDAVTGATPKKKTDVTWPLPSNLIGETITIKAEINKSFDYNETYREDLPETSRYFSGVNGQPSVIYAGTIALDSRDRSIVLEPAGTGDLRGRNGRIYGDFEGITTALNIIETVRVEWTAGKS